MAEKSVAARGKRVYVDYLQNLPGKTIATAYSVRANRFAGVSAPLRWKELSAGIRAQDFTVETIPDRLKKSGDIWADLRHTLGIDLRARYD
jgi:bifunctional non-homologous end joining protein LigD